MKPRLFIENLLLLELSPSIKLSKLRQINRALAKLGIVSGHNNIDAIGAAWALFAAAACPYARFGQIVEWLQERMEDEKVNSDHDKPVLHLAYMLTNKEHFDRIELVAFNPDGLINIVFRDGLNIIYPKKTAKEISAKVHDFTIVPGHIFKTIAMTADIKEKVLA